MYGKKFSRNPGRYTGFSDLIKCYKMKEFDSPRRSTIPLLVYWKDINNRMKALFNNLNISNKPLKDVDACFEYKVPVRKGTGRPSQTDLMICNKNITIAIEAKYTEPRYMTVKKWLKNPVSSNRKKVLNGWLNLINKVFGSNLSIINIEQIAYQLVHRTASACALPGQDRHVVYQCFNTGTLDIGYYKDELKKMASLLNSSKKINFYLLECDIQYSNKAFEKLLVRWDKGERKLAKKVLPLIRNHEIMKFNCKFLNI